MQALFIKCLVATLIFVGVISYLWPPSIWLLVIVIPLAALGFYDMIQTKHSIRRNFPLYGRGRWYAEKLRPFIRQYFIESDTAGAPNNRMFRSIVYQRSKKEMESVPFWHKTGYISHWLRMVWPLFGPHGCIRNKP